MTATSAKPRRRKYEHNAVDLAIYDDLAVPWTPEELKARAAAASEAQGITANGKPRKRKSIDPAAEPITDDIANGKRFAAQHRDTTRWHVTRKKWMHFDEKRWTIDDRHAAELKAKNTTRNIFGESAACAKAGNDHAASVLADFAKASASRTRVDAMLMMARSESGMAIDAAAFDTDPLLLNVQNGTINLRTGQLQEHQREDYISRISPAVFDPAATCPVWIATIERIMDRNPALIQFVQRMAGYGLTGLTSERCLFILHGPGANGKTTFIETIGYVLGDYACASPPQTFMAMRNEDRPRNDVARLAGIRWVSSVETSEDRRLDEALVKSLTGQDTVAARFLYGEFFDFMPAFKLALATNHKPEIRGTDPAIWDRVRLVPFNITIPMAERDKTLRERLKAEASGILNWCIAGCLAWQREGLNPPEEVAAATTEYRLESDVLQGFIDECCVIADGVSGSASVLFTAYTNWAERSGIEPLNQTQFGRRLSERGYRSEKFNRKTIRLGIAVRADEVSP